MSIDQSLIIDGDLLWEDVVQVLVDRNLVQHSTTGVRVRLDWPGASDILARRVATACGEDPGLPFCFEEDAGGPEHYWMVGDMMLTPVLWFWFHKHPETREQSAFETVVPALADLDPTDDTSLDWGNLGAPRVVDLVALGIVAQHLFEQEQNNE